MYTYCTVIVWIVRFQLKKKNIIIFGTFSYEIMIYFSDHDHDRSDLFKQFAPWLHEHKRCKSYYC